MHFPVFSEKTSVGIQDRATIVINARRAALENRNDQGDFIFFGDLRQIFRGRSRHRLRKIKKVRVFFAAKIFAAEQLVHADDLGAALGRFLNIRDGACEVFLYIRRALHLHESDGEFIGHEF